MIFVSFLILVISIIAAGVTQLWWIAIVGAGIFVASILAYFMAVNDVFGAIVIMLAAIAAPVLYITYQQEWILYVSYIAIGLWINAGSITDNDVYLEWTFEGKIYEFFDERATDALISFFSFICAAFWGLLAYLGITFSWFLMIPSLYLVVRSIIIFIKAKDYYIGHDFTLISDIKSFFKNLKKGLKKFFKGDGHTKRKFSWLSFILCIVLLALSVGLSYLEKYHLFSEFVNGILNSSGSLFESSQWYVISGAIMTEGFAWVGTLADNLLTLLLLLPAGALVIVLLIGAAILETGLSVIWLLFCLLWSLIVAGAGYFLGLVLSPLLSLALLVLTIVTFTRHNSFINRLIALLCTTVSVFSCIYFFSVFPIS